MCEEDPKNPNVCMLCGLDPDDFHDDLDDLLLIDDEIPSSDDYTNRPTHLDSALVSRFPIRIPFTKMIGQL